MKVGSTNFSVARFQHRRFRRALELAGARVIELPFVSGSFDSVFVKDNAIVLDVGDGALEAFLCNPKCPERRTEQLARSRELERNGIFVADVSDDSLEGGDVVMVPGQAAFLGHGFRSSPKAAFALEEFLGMPVEPLELRDPFLYHLDMALSVLESGVALACPEAFTPESWEKIVAHPALTKVVPVSRASALEFGLNLVQVGRQILLGKQCLEVQGALAREGYVVSLMPLDQFQRAGGSAACLVSKVHSRPALTTKPTAEMRSTFL